MKIKNVLNSLIELSEKIKWHILTGSMLIMIALTLFNIILSTVNIITIKNLNAEIEIRDKIIINAIKNIKDKFWVGDFKKDKYYILYKKKFIKNLFKTNKKLK